MYTPTKEAMDALEKRIEALEGTVVKLTGVIGILSNADKYNSTLLHSTREYAKSCYDFLISTDQFQDWYEVKNLIKDVEIG